MVMGKKCCFLTLHDYIFSIKDLFEKSFEFLVSFDTFFERTELQFTKSHS